ncbi:MAG: hypothetical protein AAB369_05970 [Chloroflexota bacterium]
MGHAVMKGARQNRGVKRGGIGKGTGRHKVPMLPWRVAELKEQASKPLESKQQPKPKK